MVTAVAALSLLVGAQSIPTANAADGDAADDEPPITADSLLDDVLLRFPNEPLDIRGEMIVRRRRGVESSRVDFSMQVDWGSTPAHFRYALYDADGDVEQEIALDLQPGARPILSSSDGAPISLEAGIGSTDLTWADLSLSFLWWRGGEIVGADSAKGRDCYLVDVPAPTWEGGPSRYHRVRLWIDQSLHMLLRADGFGADGQQMRSLWVRSLKKTDGRWMIKDMEVQGYPPVQRTRLRIHTVEARATS
ncbi:MAG: outer membrane lipoprotein-sorting protein [Lentisphaerae bacterium]|nr:outer membrane lipoprotein-sorting protein [Lentisphaerota bacterium]